MLDYKLMKKKNPHEYFEWLSYRREFIISIYNGQN